MDEKNEERRRRSLKIITVAVIVAIIGIAIYSIVTLIYRIGKVKIVLLYAPYASTVSIDDVNYLNNATHYIVPGKHHVKVEFENFKTLEEDYDMNEDMTIYGQLIAANNVGIEYAKQHGAEFDAVSGLFGQKAAEYGETIHDQYPLMNKFPIKDPHFALSYEITESNEFKIIVKASLAYRNMAITKLMENIDQEDIEEYDIEVKELQSPFTADFVNNSETDPLKYLQAGFGSAMDGFFLGASKEKDGYLYGFIRKNVGYIGDTYKFVLKRKGANWSLCGKPYPVLTSKNTGGGVPSDILYKADLGDYK